MFLFIRDFYGYYSMYRRLNVSMLYIKLLVRVYSVSKIGYIRSTRFDLDVVCEREPRKQQKIEKKMYVDDIG